MPQPNRTYVDLSGELDSLQGLYSTFARRYEDIATSLTAEDVAPQVKEAIFAGLWNAKAWYGINGAYFDLAKEANEIPADSLVITNQIDFQLNRIATQLTQLNDIVESNSTFDDPAGFWGYAASFPTWRDELYEHLKLIDSVYGPSQATSQNTLEALDSLTVLNEQMDTLLTRVESFDLPTNLTFTTTTENIDYSKIAAQLIAIEDNAITPLDINNISSFDSLSKLELPELVEGQYMLQIKNSNIVNILQTSRDGNKITLELQQGVDNLIGWYIRGIYPIIEFEQTGTYTYEVNAGNIPVEPLIFIEERHIEPINVIVDVKQNTDKAVYDFFYGSFIDEFIETLENGNKKYFRKLKDTDGNITAIYEMEIDYENQLETGIPPLKYKRLDN